jgi:hypothetical protein
MIANYTYTTANNSLHTNSLSSAPAPYIGPNPPAETPPHPHRYTQLLYHQPANFAVPASQAATVQQRRGFNLTEFTQAAGLSTPLAANYFQVVNNSLAPSPTTGTVHPTGSGAATSSQQAVFTGAANSEVMRSAFSVVLAMGGAFLLM